MGIGEAARSQGDIAYRMKRIEDAIQDLQTARRLESASVGAGGIRVQGGRLLAQDAVGDRVFEVTTEPPGIFMRQELISALTREILGEAIQIGTRIAQGTTTTENAWVDLTFGGDPDPGPQVTVDIGSSGTCLVFCAAQINVAEFGSGSMSFAGTGPQTITAGFFGNAFNSVSLETGDFSRPTCTAVMLIRNVQPGTYTLTAKYQVSNLTGAGVNFAHRVLLAIPF